MYVTERFQLDKQTCDEARKIDPRFGYNGLSEFVYYKNYSRRRPDGSFENWWDTCIRVVEGTFSIRKNHYIRNYIPWNDNEHQAFAAAMLYSLVRMNWLPPGRGLFAMGTDLIYERGAMPLLNCAYTRVDTSDTVEQLCWIMDLLMNGCGVGAQPIAGQYLLYEPVREHTYRIPDTREGWVESVRQLLNAYFRPRGSFPSFEYDDIRPEGAPIKTFGGVASGPEPLKQLHARITSACIRQTTHDAVPWTVFISDLVNMIGVCVVSGNVRRSAEILLGDPDDDDFLNLKNYSEFPHRCDWGYMSNNSVLLNTDEDFETLDTLVSRNARGLDLGFVNMRNLGKGRIGKEYVLDRADGINPCGEMPQESGEVCNVVETCPTRCATDADWFKACTYATFYASTVTLLQTHHPRTNRIIMRNRRIGVSIMDVTGWQYERGVASVTRLLREGYKHVRQVNARLADEAGVPASIRVTTIKPGGTTPKLAARTSGASYPTGKYTLRRVRVGRHEPIAEFLIAKGVPHEPDVTDPERTLVFEFPIEQGPAEVVRRVSVWEQAMGVVLLQREWADNAVSNTLYFHPAWTLLDQGTYQGVSHLVDINGATHISLFAILAGRSEVSGNHDFNLHQERYRLVYNSESRHFKLYQYNPNHEEDHVAALLAALAPLTKSVSLCPHSATGLFKQLPEEGLTQDEYRIRLAAFPKFDWSEFTGARDGTDERYCSGPACELGH